MGEQMVEQMVEQAFQLLHSKGWTLFAPDEISLLVAENERMRVALEHVDRLLTRVMDESNLHIFEPVAATVTAALSDTGGTCTPLPTDPTRIGPES